MTTYLVAVWAPDDKPFDRLEQKWPGRVRRLEDRAAFVAPSDASLTSDIGRAAGMNPEQGVEGIVLEVNRLGIYGFGPSEDREWLRKMQ